MCEMVSQTLVGLLGAWALFINRITLCSSSQMTGLQRSRQSPENKRLCFVLSWERRRRSHESFMCNTVKKLNFQFAPKQSETVSPFTNNFCWVKLCLNVSLLVLAWMCRCVFDEAESTRDSYHLLVHLEMPVCVYCMRMCSVLQPSPHCCVSHTPSGWPLWLRLVMSVCYRSPHSTWSTHQENCLIRVQSGW